MPKNKTKNRHEIHKIQPRPLFTGRNQIVIRGICKNAAVNLLIDTGAAISVINTRLVETLNIMHKIMPTTRIIAGLDNNIVKTHGDITLPLTIGTVQKMHTFIVCDELENEFLIGMDILKKFEIKIDIPNKKVNTPHGKIEFLEKPVTLAKREKLKCNKTEM